MSFANNIGMNTAVNLMWSQSMKDSSNYYKNNSFEALTDKEKEWMSSWEIIKKRGKEYDRYYVEIAPIQVQNEDGTISYKAPKYYTYKFESENNIVFFKECYLPLPSEDKKEGKRLILRR